MTDTPQAKGQNKEKPHNPWTPILIIVCVVPLIAAVFSIGNAGGFQTKLDKCLSKAEKSRYSYDTVNGKLVSRDTFIRSATECRLKYD